ncbi:hypothetical protein ACIBG0_41940 [Nocardia sp. NPDC050630]|uniref:hypothetical protein n=1 Tax=Nocardia sp. NPDC050630 TaxID=3364321 RepID=UPI0037B69006
MPISQEKSSARTSSTLRARQVILSELRTRDRWVMWKQAYRGGLPTKVPIQPTGKPASSTNPATWSPWPRVRPAARKGYVLGEASAASTWTIAS